MGHRTFLFVLGLAIPLGILIHLRPNAAALSPLPPISFRDVARKSGITPRIISEVADKKYILEVNGSGCAWLDYNQDGNWDLYIANGSTLEALRNSSRGNTLARNYLFRNNGDGTFIDVTHEAKLNDSTWSNGVIAADFDNDGLTDLLVTNFGANNLYRKQGDGTFVDVALQAGVSSSHLVWSTGAAFGDYDKDGDLDLYVAGYVDFDIHNPPTPEQFYCTYRNRPVQICGPRGLKGAPDALYRNNGDGTFTDVTIPARVVDEGLYYGFAVAMEDFDGDTWPEIIVANDSNPNYYYRNLGDGTFEEVGAIVGTAYNYEGMEQSDMGMAIGDVDNDGWTDLFTTTFADDNFTLFHNDGKGIFTDISFPSGLAEPTIPSLGWSAFFLDYNNDGWKDLFCVNGHVYPEVTRLFKDVPYRQRPQLFRNRGGGKFLEANREVGLDDLQLPGRGGAFCDYDNDGDLDILIVNIDEQPVFLQNQGGHKAGNWLQIKTVGVKSNRDGIGARVKVVAGGLTLYDRVRTGGTFLSGNDTRLHFGLGTSQIVDLIEVLWPSGQVDRFPSVPANQALVVEEGKSEFRRAHGTKAKK